MIRVLQIVPTLGYGGVAQFLLNYYKKMDKSEIIFDFVTHGKVESFHQELLDAGSQIFYLNTIGEKGIKKYLAQLRNIFENNSYNIVHTHDGHLVGVTAFLVKRYFKGTVICHAHTTLCATPNHRKFMPFFRWMARRYGDVLLGCGTLACKYIFGDKSKFEVIHNAVDVDRFQNVDSKDVVALREQLDIPKDGFVIGHVGLFTPPKNHFYLIEIFEKVYRKSSNAFLVLVGGGDLQDEVRNKCIELGVIDRVRFVGKQSNIPLYMHLFDVFALPSLWEGLPVVGVEAQAAGLHCVFSDTIDHDVDAGMNMVDFVSISDIDLDTWVDALLKIVNKPSRKTIDKAMKSSGYEIDSSIDCLMSEYKQILYCSKHNKCKTEDLRK